jgi:phospholipid/cholesterol/gamma-HCH transport system substrate-binding protein
MSLLKQLMSKEVKIAVVTIVAMGIIIYGINYLKGINIFQPSMYYFVKFNDVNGLTKSSPVFTDGYRIGIVNDIIYDYNHPGNIAVKIETDTEMKLPKNSAAIISSNLMGGLRLNLIIPKIPAGYCAIGDTISGNLDTGLMSTVSQLVPSIEKMLPKLDSIITSINIILADPSIRTTLHSLEKTSGNLEVASAGLKQLMGNDIPNFTKKLNTVGDNAITLTHKLNDIDFEATMAKVDSTLNNVKQLTGKMNDKDNSLGLLLNDRSVYDNLNGTFTNASNLLIDLKSNPKKYVHFSLFGKKNK